MPRADRHRMQRVLRPFVLLAALGFVASTVVHVVTLLTPWELPNGLVLLFALGVFVVGFPAVFYAQPFMLDVRSTRHMSWMHPYYGFADQWDALGRGSPLWMKRMTGGCFVYYLLSFVSVFVVARYRDHSPDFDSRMLYAGLMALYAALLETLYSALVVARRERERRCTAGHLVLPADDGKYCAICRRPVVDPPAT